MAERKKKRAKRLPRRRVHSMALGGVIKHMGWKLSRFTPCSRGVAGFFCCCCCCCSCKMKFIHEHKLEANLLTCFTDLPDAAVTLCSDRELQPRPTTPRWSSCPSLSSPATCCLPCTRNNIQSPNKTLQLHKWWSFCLFKLLYQRAPNPGRNKIQPCHSLVVSQISLH